MSKDDIRLDSDVVKTFWEMKGVTDWLHKYGQCTKLGQSQYYCHKCKVDADPHGDCPIPDPIPLSVGDLAFYMRDVVTDRGQANDFKWVNKLYTLVSPPVGCPFFVLEAATPEQWITAACVAYREGQKDESL